MSDREAVAKAVMADLDALRHEAERIERLFNNAGKVAHTKFGEATADRCVKAADAIRAAIVEIRGYRDALALSPEGREGWKLVPADAGTCELDDSGWLLVFMRELHSGVPEGERPTGWSDFSDGQRDRIKAAYRAMLAAAPPPSGGAQLPENPAISAPGNPIAEQKQPVDVAKPEAPFSPPSGGGR